MKTINKLYLKLLLLSGTLICSLTYNGIAINVNYISEYIKVWGCLKYSISYTTNYIPNFDSVFLTDVKQMINSNRRKDFDYIVNKLVEYSKVNSIKTYRTDSIYLNLVKFDSIDNWIFNNDIIPKSCIYYLLQITGDHTIKNNPFVENKFDTFNAVFKNEKRYISPFPSTELRLLALARYWNAINYFFPHKKLISLDWNMSLDPFIVKIIKCKDEFEFHSTILRFITLIEDGHGFMNSYSIEKFYGFYQLPLEVSYINNQLIVTKILNTDFNNPFRHGDKLLEIDKQSFDEYYMKDSCFIWGSNIKRKRNISANNYLKSREAKNLLIKINRNDTIIKTYCHNIESASYKNSELVDYKINKEYIIGENYIYLNLNIIDSIGFETMIRSANKPNIIIDLRYYPNWILNQIADLFAPKDVPFAMYKYPIISTPGLFSSPHLLYLEPRKESLKQKYDRIILLVDYTTISRGEFLCMAFQSLPNVLTFGDKTAGADGNISKVLLPGNIYTQFSGLEILYPDGKPTQQTGVKIDMYFQKRGDGISKGQDEELSYILQNIIKEGKN